MTDREMYNSYLDGNREAVRQDDGTIMREIDNANRVEEQMPQTPATSTTPVLPQIQGSQPQQTGPTYQQLFPNDELGVGIDMRNQ